MTSARPRFWTPPPRLRKVVPLRGRFPFRGLVALTRGLASTVARCRPEVGDKARAHLVDAEKHMLLAVSSLSIAELIETQGDAELELDTPEADASTTMARRDG